MANGHSGFRPTARPVVGVDVDILGRPIRRRIPTGSTADPSGVDWSRRPTYTVDEIRGGGQAAPRQSVWQKLGRATRNVPGAGTVRGLGKVASYPIRFGAYAARGLPGLVAGSLAPSDIATAEQEFDPNQFADVQGQPIEGMRIQDPRAQSAYGGDPNRWMRQMQYGDVDVPSYDAEMLQNLQSQYAQQDRAELEAKPVEDLSWWESSQRALYRVQDSLKAALAGESTPEERKPAPVYNLAKTGEDKRTDTPVASSTTKALGSEIPVETRSSTDRILELIGTTGGGVDWKDTEKTYGMLAAMGILSDQGTGIASNFLSGVTDMARLKNDEKWRMVNLLKSPKVPWYPVLPSGGGTYVLDTSGKRPIISQNQWESPPGGGFGYSPIMPAAPASSKDMIEYAEAKRLMKEEGITAAWAFKQGLGGLDTSGGLVRPDIAIGAYLAPIWYDLHPDMPIKIIPEPYMLQDTVKKLNGRTFAEAVAAGDLDEEDWEMWISTYGNFRPTLGMTK